MEELMQILEEADKGGAPEITQEERDSLVILSNKTIEDDMNEESQQVEDIKMDDGKSYRIESIGPLNAGVLSAMYCIYRIS